MRSGASEDGLDLVGRVVAELRRSGELDETLIVFTSDNGYLRGQHRIDSGKSKLYDESLRVPLFVRGPGFAAGRKVAAPVVNVDLAATIVALAGLEPSHPLDGVPLQVASGPDGGRRAVLTEVFERKQDRFQGIRTARYLYARHSDGEIELYDRRHDPGELKKLAGPARPPRRSRAARGAARAARRLRRRRMPPRRRVLSRRYRGRISAALAIAGPAMPSATSVQPSAGGPPSKTRLRTPIGSSQASRSRARTAGRGSSSGA